MGITRNLDFANERKSTATVRRLDSVTETTHLVEVGKNGRPRVKEEVILPPQYEEMDLFDANEPILF